MPNVSSASARLHISPQEARHLLRAALPARGSEQRAVQQALGRVLAQDLSAKVDHPSLDESALDGIACFCDEAGPLRLVGESRAGQPFAGQLERGQCIRIYTGAPLPRGGTHDHLHAHELGICPVEEISIEGEWVTLGRPALAKDIRRQGEDFAQGDLILPAGQALGVTHLALAAAAGHAELPVYRPWRVGLLSTGDEVVPVGQPLQAGQVYDSNHVGLGALLGACGCEVVDLGHAPDEPRQLAAQLGTLAPLDLILSSGGVSMGEYDFLRHLLFDEGEVLFWKVNMRPGGPALLGRWNGTLVFGLPGNPVSSLVVFMVLLQPLLCGHPEPRTLRLRAGEDLRAVPNKTAFWRADIRGHEVYLVGTQGSGQMRAFAQAQALAIVPAGQAISAGQDVEVLPLHQGGAWF